MTVLPTGTLTFLFTDVEGSTRLWASNPDAMSKSLALHDQILRTSIESHNGYVFTTAGDAFCAAFQRASDAVRAAELGQASLAATRWHGPELRVRMGLHLGEAVERGGDYFGPVLNTTARVEAAGHGGQVLFTSGVRTAAAIAGTSLGTHHLRDVGEALEIWQLGDHQFPALRSEAERSNLPLPPTRLMGRVEDVRAVRALLAAHRLVTVAAVGGIGKTRLAIEVGDQEVPHFPGGVWFVDLTKVDGDLQVAAEIADVIGFEVRQGDPVEKVAAFAGSQSLLLILDNCEHVVDVCADFAAAMLATHGESRLLATSREWLDVEGEFTYQLPSLSTDSVESTAVRLFAERARRVVPGFAVDDRNSRDVVALCKRLDGVPLAIELAAARSPVFSPTQLLAGLDDRFALLSGGRRRQRHRTLEATIDWSYDLLDPDERTAFMAIGVFAGTFDLGAIESVCQLSSVAAADMIEALIAKSLVVQAGGGRFRLLEMLKAYAEDRLLDSGNAGTVRDLHLDHYLELFEFPDLQTQMSLVYCRRWDLVADAANGIAAAAWAESQEHPTVMAQLLIAMNPTMLAKGDLYGPLKRLQRCADLLDDELLGLRVLWCQVGYYIELADWSSMADSVGRLGKSSNPNLAGFVYIGQSLLIGRSDPAAAHATIDRGLVMWADLDQPEVMVHACRSFVELYEGDFEAAEDSARAAIESARLLGILAFMIPVCHWGLAVCAWVRGDFGEVRRQARNELCDTQGMTDDLMVESGMAFFEALASIGTACEQGGAGSASAEQIVRSFALVANTGRLALEANDAVTLLVVLAMAEGDLETARRLVMHTGSPRSPASGSIAQETARRLGVGDDLESAYRSHFTDTAWMVEQPSQALRAEIHRRGWIQEP